MAEDRWTAGQAPINGAGNVYANVLETFFAIMPPIPPAHVAAAREAGRLFARSIVCADRIIDGDIAHGSFGENVLTAQVCQLEGVRLLQPLVPPEHPFWSALAGRLREFADACAAELAGTEYDVLAAERIALGKNALARLAAPVACAIAGTEAPLAELDRGILDLIIAVQALDDAVDWRTDLARRQVSLVTARIWERLGRDAAGPTVDALVHTSVLRDVLGIGRAALAHALAIPVLQGSAGWTRLTGRIAHGYDHALALLAYRETPAERSVRTPGSG